GGLPCAEITFRTETAGDSIAILAAKFPTMLVGAGTVLTLDQARQAQAAGAGFIVTPGFDEAIVDWCLVNDMPVTPGVITPTEISLALNKGLNLLKFFPAELSGGISYLKAMAGPFSTVKFMPTGGIDRSNLADYLRLSNVHACGGSWMVKPQLIAEQQFEKIKALSKETVELARAARGIRHG
ncbi:MAG: bifunctional 4-hydroxy-2-oxoglutarate aldolase/2-dehydro-3-deoxy-phosphogluconate aldolase, partial [Anaerolineae bacterium]|nr:bifunctional 4-hydroxy-2-oxoglutarate aldolase/2-dehydro-3-deoxy-phosphogluconate aldolase [Anaerolineae bacterium]